CVAENVKSPAPHNRQGKRARVINRSGEFGTAFVEPACAQKTSALAGGGPVERVPHVGQAFSEMWRVKVSSGAGTTARGCGGVPGAASRPRRSHRRSSGSRA